MSQELIQSLNKQVANWTVLYVKLHNFHWFIKGPHFFTLHEKFEELYNEAAVYIDELAERILALEGRPVATMREYLELSSVKEATGSENEEDMVRTISDDFSTVAAELQEAINLAEAAEDEGTADILIGIKKSLRKHTWMFNAYLK
ncbi:DNA starvation/stationary phase protection protein [Bacillus canaveralius]|uniref:DNA starvation/stationary phase protection protein n=1 Tax=Bacillus canaveralius TaxID=1403243 RepID=A0A2N5GPI8_9BACI|nr:MULTISPECIES: Dps family protein [Bacillus]PLR84441.1 DNA starvation/stationary phase protection protein [Bacillus canaveralius]PLR86974.1 DNA starvation/stationary phase protection protein [Bacillus sp. V33-4]PLS00557.1 DNA starvation/stationary phase protection protein [Bacillus canaveralius]RSK57842.1 DNA starvation/stationary phase protection protein [Bacillus canaveralius]